MEKYIGDVVNYGDNNFDILDDEIREKDPSETTINDYYDISCEYL